MGRLLTNLGRPFIVCVLTDRSVAEAARTIARADAAGAEVYELNLPMIAGEDLESLGALISSTSRPVYTSCRRASFMAIYGRGSVPEWSEEDRMERQLQLLAAGSVAVDIELDAFGPGRPEGFTDDAGAILAQREVARATHLAGGQVISSCHSGTALSPDEILAVAARARDREADMLKVVSAVSSQDEALATLAGALRALKSQTLPTTFVCAGVWARFTRLLAPALCSGWFLCQEALPQGGFADQPLVSEVASLRPLLDWMMGGE